MCWRVSVHPSNPPPLAFRLEEQTKRLQKDMKKSTDADLGEWPSSCPSRQQKT